MIHYLECTSWLVESHHIVPPALILMATRWLAKMSTRDGTFEVLQDAGIRCIYLPQFTQ